MLLGKPGSGAGRGRLPGGHLRSAGFGASSQPWGGYDYDSFAADLEALLEQLDLTDVALVGFSMGGGEVARHISTYGAGRVSRAVFASAVPPYLHKSADNPDGGLDDAAIAGFEAGVRADRLAFLDRFATGFFQAGDRTDLISAPRRAYHLDIVAFASPKGTLDCIGAFARTDFRADLAAVGVPKRHPPRAVQRGAAGLPGKLSLRQPSGRPAQ